MQKKGREREDGTVILGTSISFESLGLVQESADRMLSEEGVVACTDPRVTPEEFLGMGEGNSTSYLLAITWRWEHSLSL